MTMKPDLNRVWAEGAPGGNIEDPDVTVPGKFDAGWEAEIPPFENFNFLQQLFTQGLAHINEEGVAQWDAVTDYLVGSLVKGSDGVLYKSRVTPNINNDPTSSTTEWTVAFYNPHYYVDSGSADDYEVAATGDTITPNRFMDGIPVTFRPDFDNTGASTIEISGLVGVKDIKTSAGADPAAGTIVAGELLVLIYDLANDRFEISNGTSSAPSNVVQIVSVQDGEVATGTTSMVFDDTIPQNTEGDEFMTLAITPKSATNLLVIDITISTWTLSGNTVGGVALFQDSTASALASQAMQSIAASNNPPLGFRHHMVSGTTSSTTFKIRIGGQSANTFTFNGSLGSRVYGGSSASSITITEYKA